MNAHDVSGQDVIGSREVEISGAVSNPSNSTPQLSPLLKVDAEPHPQIRPPQRPQPQQNPKFQLRPHPRRQICRFPLNG